MRDWAALPREVLAAVLRKLDHIEILMGPGQACRSWRCAARDDPALWRRIDMRGHADLFYQLNLHGMAQAAVRRARIAIRRAKGQCEAFWAEYAADDGVLQLLGEQSASLKILNLISCHEVSNKGFAELVTKSPLLEDLSLELCPKIGGRSVYESTGKACPQLKRFSLRRECFRFSLNYPRRVAYPDRYREARGFRAMRELRSLSLVGSSISNKELEAILDRCPHLETLFLRDCYAIKVAAGSNLRAKCARIKTVTLRQFKPVSVLNGRRQWVLQEIQLPAMPQH
ncbi:hypothetical protein HU200_005084 [Digitaria exilis]|uniref:F-box domain-containing protein n=1 Tax=Digitaria exilis TaxID=1010633 RepID=A0A835FSM7_9POAL|nr:hypothetical protein HU200_005084 [Digitaria exilis]